MIIYEVNLKIYSEIYEAFILWLKPHIKEILACKGFKHARFLKEQNNEAPSFNYITIHYYVDHLDNLNDYLNHHAQHMREEGLKAFPEQFTASRRFLELQEEILNY